MTTARNTGKSDPGAILDALRLILEAGQVTELRALDAVTPADRRPHVESGYFDDPEKLARAVAGIAHAKGIYLVPKPVNPALLARAVNKLRPAPKGESTQDGDILRRRWLPIDTDPVRPSGIASTDAEHRAALDRAAAIAAALAAEGWPSPIGADSGNGGHLLYRIDLPAGDGGLVQRCLQALAARFDDDAVKVDQSVFNPARIWKLYGTTAGKGDAEAAAIGRPHRLARVLTAPDPPAVVPPELLEALAAQAPAAAPAPGRPGRRTPRAAATPPGDGAFDLDGWFRGHGLPVSGPEEWRDQTGQSGRRWVFEVCPWNPAHTDRSAYVVQLATGAIAAGCHHNGCAGNDWHALRDAVEPGLRDKSKTGRAEGEAAAAAKKGPPQASLLVGLAEAAELFHTPDGDPFATVKVDNHAETWPLRSRGFRRWLAGGYYRAYGKAPGGQALQDVLTVLEGQAVFAGAERQVFTRLGEAEGAIFLDLADPGWRAVRITAAGWSVVDQPLVRFRRPRGLLALPEPGARGAVEELRDFVNVPGEADWKLLVAWLLAALCPRGPYPVLVLHGEQGSAKSTTARVLRALIDPNTAALRPEPREVRDLVIAAGNGWVVALDNLSHLTPWVSDALCRLSTGGGFGTRELYTDAEEVLFDAQRPLILTGIEELATRGDLLDRAIVLHLPAIPEGRCRTEAELWGGFDQARPRILGALLDAVAAALRHLPEVRLPRLPRMADFALWVTAAEGALGWPKGSFLDAYTGNRGEANELALEASPLAGPLRELATAGGWQGTCAELLDKLAKQAGERSTRSPSWPQTPRALGGALRRLTPNLRRVGILVEMWREPGGRRPRMVRIRAGGS
jgi:hypothetical protein